MEGKRRKWHENRKPHAFDTNLDLRYNRTSVHWANSTLKRSRRGQMRQVRQMRGRFKIANLPQTPKLDRSPLSFERGKCGRVRQVFKNLSARESMPTHLT